MEHSRQDIGLFSSGPCNTDETFDKPLAAVKAVSSYTPRVAHARSTRDSYRAGPLALMRTRNAETVRQACGNETIGAASCNESGACEETNVAQPFRAAGRPQA
jgi:hypothetical protein